MQVGGAARRETRTRAARPGGAGPLTLIELDSAVGCHGCVTSLDWMNHSLFAAVRQGVSGRVRLARSDVDRVFGTGAGCGGARDYVRCVRPVVRLSMCCLMNRWNGRSAGRVAVST